MIITGRNWLKVLLTILGYVPEDPHWIATKSTLPGFTSGVEALCRRPYSSW